MILQRLFREYDVPYLRVAAILDRRIWPPGDKISLSSGGYRKAIALTIHDLNS